jgi:E3 ubiquitin-protein ligase RAD18
MRDLDALLNAVSDISDFDEPELRELDSAFRCTICRELYDAPVTLNACGHTFCSIVCLPFDLAIAATLMTRTSW